MSEFSDGEEDINEVHGGRLENIISLISSSPSLNSDILSKSYLEDHRQHDWKPYTVLNNSVLSSFVSVFAFCDPATPSSPNARTVHEKSLQLG